MKNIRRVAAGDYSRDLSAGVFAGRCRIVTLGFKTGGTPRYGLQRVLIDQFGNERCVLKPGDRKSLHSDRVVLPGPPKAVKMVQQVFRWFVLERKSELEIARELNERKILNEFGRPWRMLAIRRHLEDEKYLGNYVYNRKSGKLKTPRTPNPENTWVRCNGAFEAIIDPAIFAEAGKIIVGRGGPCAPGSPTAGCWRCSRRGYIQILTIPIQFRIRMADGAWRFCVRRSNVMERQRLLGHPYEEGFDPLGARPDRVWRRVFIAA